MANFNLTIRFRNGSREPLQGKRITVSVLNGRGKLLGTRQIDASDITLALPLSGDPIADQFTLNASTKGHRDAGFTGLRPADGQTERTLHLLLVERDARLVFRRRSDWPAAWPPVEIGDGLFDLADVAPANAACLLNLIEAIRLLPNGNDVLKAISVPLVAGNSTTRERREEGVLKDRALLRATKDLQPALETLLPHELVEKVSSAAHGQPKPEEKAVSYKERRFAQGNLQFTLFSGPDTIYADIDMDYHRSGLSHGLLEVLPNTLFGTKTDPRQIYALRWMASRNEGQASDQEFAPPYVLAV